jgi:hypothetical protein
VWVKRLRAASIGRFEPPSYNTADEEARRYFRYVPSVLLGLLGLLWFASWYGSIGWVFPAGRLKQVALRCERSSVECTGSVRRDARMGPYWRRIPWKPSAATYLGTVQIDVTGNRGFSVVLPIVGLATALLPLAVGALTGFRYRLWHWLVLLALLGFDLAYFL